MHFFKNRMVMKMVVVILAAFFFVISGATMLAYAGFTTQMQKEFNSSALSVLRQASQQADLMLQAVDRHSINFQHGNDANLFMNRSYKTELDRVRTVVTLQNALRNIRQSNDNIYSLGMYSFASGMVLSDREYLPIERCLDTEWADVLDLSENHRWMDAREVVDTNEVRTRVVTLVRTYPLGVTKNPKGLIFINVKQEALNRALQDLLPSQSGWVLAVNDASGAVISYSDGTPLDDPGRLAELLGASPRDSTGSYSLTLEDGAHTVFYTHSAYTGWRYASIYPNMDIQSVASMRSRMMQIAVVMFLLVVPLALVVARFAFGPLHSFLERTLSTIQLFNPANELNRSTISFDSIERIFTDTLASNRELEKQLLDKKRLVKWRLVTDLLIGRRQEQTQIADELDFIGARFEWQTFGVIVFFPDDRSKLQRAHTASELRSFLERVIEWAEALSRPAGGVEVMAIELNEGGVGLLANLDTGPEDHKLALNTCQTLAEEVLRAAEALPFTLSAGVSPPVPLAGVSRAYRAATDAARRAAQQGGGRIVAGDRLEAPALTAAPAAGQEPYSAQIMPRIIEYLGTRYVDPNMSLQLLAEEFHLSVPYLSKLFKTNTGTKYADYLAELRIAKARELLALDVIKINEVSERVGYQNPPSFIRAFKRYTGTTPGGYRQGLYLEKQAAPPASAAG